MQHVAADRHGEIFKTAAVQFGQVAANGQSIQQCLGGMLMGAVAGIDHTAIQLAGKKFGGAGILMPHHQHVGTHGVQGAGGIDQSLALGHGRCLDAHIEHVGAQPFARQLETGLGAGGGFKEQIDQGAALQHRGLFVGTAVEGDIGLGKVEKTHDLGRRKAFDPQQMAGLEDRARLQDRRSVRGCH